VGTHRSTVGDLLTTVRVSLRDASVPDADLEGELLLMHALGMDRARLFASLREPARLDAEALISPLLERRVRREPLTYITGSAEFFGRRFAVDRRVLVPRPETELLVDRALEAASRSGIARPRIADVGTGSGVLAITLALELPDAGVDAVDSSQDALEVARSNGGARGVAHRVTWLQGHLSEPLRGRYHLVVANLPYVRTDALRGLQPEIAYEPETALDGGPDGMRYIGPLVRELPGLLAGAGAASLLEIDPPIEALAVRAAQAALPDAEVRVWPDLAGLARCLEITLS